ncbi:MAG: GxxExxY protein [Candidatus Cloacimonetes bacterium]|nr:GxxExxY protein [Candidatus Cloacimonadota bacterium]
MHERNYQKDVCSEIIDSFFIVYNNLGFGYLEKVYENALRVELESKGLGVQTQKPIKVIYKGVVVGEYFADLFVDNSVIVEIKTAAKLTSENESQLLNYLTATNTEHGVLLNFGPKPAFRCMISSLSTAR